MDVDLRSLRYFVTVAEELNFSKAAERLNISQPPLSFAIKQLEESLAVKLFERNSRKVQLTSEGLRLYKEALFLLSYTNSLKNQLAQLSSLVPLRIGFVGSMMYRGLSELLVFLKHKHPEVQFELFESNSGETIHKVEIGHLDLGFIHTNKLPNDVVGEAIFDEPFVLCTQDKTDLINNRGGANLADFKHESFVFFARDASPTYYELLLSLCISAGFFPKMVGEANHWLSILSMVSQRIGVSIVPECMKLSGLPNLKFADFEHSQRSITSLIWSEKKRTQLKSLVTQSILEFYSNRK